MPADINIKITIDGLFSKWVGAELVSAIDLQNPHMIAYVLRNRRTLVSTTMLGHDTDPNVEIWIDALTDSGREPVVIFEMSKSLYQHEPHETERQTMNKLAALVHDNSFSVSLLDDEEECTCEMHDIKPVPADKTSN